MISIKFLIKYPLISLILITVLSSCMQQSGMGVAGVLKGKITIGPLCPVETVPPLPNCQPTLETYKTWATAIWTLNKKSKVITLNPSIDGDYQVSIPSGKYIVDFSGTQNYRFGSNLPSEITVLPNDTVIFNINIDTGIR